MSILTKEDRKDLVYAVRKSLLEQVSVEGVLTESKKASAKNFILNEATYQELLNLAYNPDRDTSLLKTEALEAIAMKEYEDYLTEDVVEESVFGQIEEGIGGAVRDGAKAVGSGIRAVGRGVSRSGKGVTAFAKKHPKSAISMGVAGGYAAGRSKNKTEPSKFDPNDDDE